MVAWRAAATIMVLFTIVTVMLRILGLGPFTDVFDLFILYLPTAILVGRIVFTRTRGSPGQSDYVMSDPSPGGE